ncbi:MAG: hypothetical protein LUD18_02465 [Lachnospiraceae bacterium]|nr:hypothetical protein [Lachnospiraceae bacterium]
MNFLNKMERKFGKYAIPNLPAILIALYVAGYVIELMNSNVIWYLYLSPTMILRGQIWRLITWVIIPPYSLDVFVIITLYFYFSIGKTLERTWGVFRFNVYIFSGMLFTLIGAFLLYFIAHIDGAYYFSTYYVCMSMFLAFAVTYPDMEVLLMFIIPIKMKWLGILYGVLLLASLVQGNIATRVAIISSLLNFVIYFAMTRNLYRYNPHEIHRRQEFNRKVKKVQPGKGNTRHRCAVCGRTEKDGDHLEFRYCSKCEGNYEYCQDHLFTHQHKKKSM